MMKSTKKSKPTAAKPASAKVGTQELAGGKLTATSVKPVTGGVVSLEFVKPEAKRVCVAGSFNQWKPETTPLSPAGNGRWTGSLNVRPGRYEYLFVVDGQWLPDPNAKETVNNPYGGWNSVLEVSE